jgi:hypothetical protein
MTVSLKSHHIPHRHSQSDKDLAGARMIYPWERAAGGISGGAVSLAFRHSDERDRRVVDTKKNRQVTAWTGASWLSGLESNAGDSQT